jgi:hypothetical protein
MEQNEMEQNEMEQNEMELESEPLLPDVAPDIVEPMEPIVLTQNEIPAETIEISKEATKIILNNVEKQPSKYWHFQFKNDRDKTALDTIFKTLGLTAEYNTKQDTPDITLKDDSGIVGKIHLLLCDRRDTNNKEKYYCKIYFYHFKNPKIYSDVRAAVINYFENFKAAKNNFPKNNFPKNNFPKNNSSRTNTIGGKRKRRTHKKRINKKKKTLRRK